MTAQHARGRARADKCHRRRERIVPFELPPPPLPVVTVDVRAGTDGWDIADIKRAALRHPGHYRLALLVGERTLTFGPDWSVDASRELVAALEPFGLVEVREAGP
jgi:hypothetical protein